MRIFAELNNGNYEKTIARSPEPCVKRLYWEEGEYKKSSLLNIVRGLSKRNDWKLEYEVYGVTLGFYNAYSVHVLRTTHTFFRLSYVEILVWRRHRL